MKIKLGLTSNQSVSYGRLANLKGSNSPTEQERIKARKKRKKRK